MYFGPGRVDWLSVSIRAHLGSTHIHPHTPCHPLVRFPPLNAPTFSAAAILTEDWTLAILFLCCLRVVPSMLFNDLIVCILSDRWRSVGFLELVNLSC